MKRGQTHVDGRPLVRCCPACARRIETIEDVPLVTVESVRVFRELRAPRVALRHKSLAGSAVAMKSTDAPETRAALQEEAREVARLAEAIFQQEGRDVARLAAVRRYLGRLARLAEAKVPTSRLLPTWREGWSRKDGPIPGSPCRPDWLWVVWLETRWSRGDMHALLDVTLVHQDGGYASDESFHATRLGTLAQLRVRGLLNAKKVSP